MIYDVWLSQFYIHNKAEMIIYHREEFPESSGEKPPIAK